MRLFDIFEDAPVNWRTATHAPDFNTCVVDTIAYLLDKPKDVIWLKARAFWNPQNGMRLIDAGRVLDAFGFQFGRLRGDLMFAQDTRGGAAAQDKRYRPLGDLYRALQTEPRQTRFFIGTKGHAIGYANGKPLDVGQTAPGTWVNCVYEVVPKGSFREGDEDRESRLAAIPNVYRLPSLHIVFPDAERVAPDETVCVFSSGPLAPGDTVDLRAGAVETRVKASEIAFTGTGSYIFAPRTIIETKTDISL